MNHTGKQVVKDNMNFKKIIVLIAVAALVFAFFLFDLGRFLSLDYLKQSQSQFAQLYADNPAQIIGVFFAIYVAVTALSLPGAAIMTLAAGAIFGLVTGTVIVSFASTIGATLAESPGIAVRAFGAAPSRPVIRGLDGDRVSVLEDGQRVS